MIPLSELSALLQVVVVDLVLAGDNAIIVGLVAASLPREQRAKVIMIGILAATALRIMFAVVTTQLLQIIGLTLAGGLLLLWVCWKLWRELRVQAKCKANGEAAEQPSETRQERAPGRVPDRAGRHLHVAGQCARGSRHRAAPHLGADRRPGAFSDTDGGGGRNDRRAC